MKTKLYSLLVLFLFTSCIAKGDSKGIETAPATFSEVGRLEKIFTKRTLFTEERDVLLGLYFLHGDCDNIVEVLQDKREPIVPISLMDQDLLCACDGKCDFVKLSEKARFQQKLAALKSLLKFDHKLMGPGELARIWSQLKDYPQAQEIAYKALSKSNKKEDQILSQKILTQLKAL